MECSVIVTCEGHNYNKLGFSRCGNSSSSCLNVNKEPFAWSQRTVFGLFGFCLLSWSFLQGGGLEAAGRLTAPLLFSASLFALTDPC